MTTSVKGVCSVLIIIVTVRLSACATIFYNITRGATLGPFEAISVSGGLQTPFSLTAADRDSGVPTFSPIALAAGLSASDVTLIQALLTGGRLDQVDIGFYTGSQIDPRQQYLNRKITLNQAVIPSYKSQAAIDDVPVTTFTILFAKYTDTTYPRGANGVPTRPRTTTYDLLSSKPATTRR